MFRSYLLLLTCFSGSVVSPALRAQSFYPVRLDDKAAIFLSDSRFGARGDGVADDTAALGKRQSMR